MLHSTYYAVVRGCDLGSSVTHPGAPVVLCGAHVGVPLTKSSTKSLTKACLVRK